MLVGVQLKVLDFVQTKYLLRGVQVIVHGTLGLGLELETLTMKGNESSHVDWTKVCLKSGAFPFALTCALSAHQTEIGFGLTAAAGGLAASAVAAVAIAAGIPCNTLQEQKHHSVCRICWHYWP